MEWKKKLKKNNEKERATKAIRQTSKQRKKEK